MRWCFFAVLAACHASSPSTDTDPPSEATDTSVADTGADSDTSTLDTGTSSDSDALDTDRADTDTTTDTTTDTDIADTDVSDPGVDPWPDTGTDGCSWIDLGASVARCGERWSTVSEMVDTEGDPTCETWYQRDGLGYSTIDEALRECDASCVYVPAIAVMVLYCGYRGEYTEFADGGPGQTAPVGSCAKLVYGETYAGSGWASTWDDFTRAHPCPTPTE